MNLWIISTKEAFAEYSNNRFLEEVKAFDITLQIFKPSELDVYLGAHERKLICHGKPQPFPDVLLVRTGASTITYHTLALMKFLELSGQTRVINPFATYTRARDKVLTLLHLAAEGIPVPKTHLLTRTYDLDIIKREFQFPVVVKEIAGARGNSVVFADSPAQLDELLSTLFTVKRPNAELLLQECVHTSLGKDIRVYVVGDRILGAIQRKAQGDTRRSNVSLGGEVQPVTLTDEMTTIVRQVQKTLGLEIGGIDLLYAANGFMVCEVNLSGQFVGFEKATHVNVAGEILRYCAMSPKL